MKLFRGVGIFGSVVLMGMANLAGCSNAAREASSNDAPVAEQVTLSTANQPAHVGTVLQGSYRFSDADGDSEKDTLKAWLRNGTPIEGANQDNYTATAQDSGKSLQYSVTPTAASGESPGKTVMSSGITIENSAPVVTLSTPLVGASSTKTTGVGSELRVDYTYSDVDDDAAAAIEIRWLRYIVSMSPASISPIPNATSRSYTVTRADLGYALVAEVTPTTLQGVPRGTAVSSESIEVVNSVPVAQNVELTASTTPVVVGTLLTASYSYFDADGDPENKNDPAMQEWQWLLNGKAIDGANALKYTLTADDANARIQFTVMPHASKGNSPGEMVMTEALTVTNSAPQAGIVGVSGATVSASVAVVGDTLHANYSYSDLDRDPEGASVRQWVRGTTDIPNANGVNYTITAADSGSKLLFKVTPFASQGLSPGAPVSSTPITVTNSAPVAKNVKLSANTMPISVGSILTANYDYFDADNDAEIPSGSSIQWWRDNVKILNAQGKTYTLVSADVGTGTSITISFEVTPMAKAGVPSGSSTRSNGISNNNSAPTATNVSITPSTALVNTVLTGNYTYSDTDIPADPEGTSLYEWSNGTTVLGTAKIYTVKATDAHKTLTFKVTPVPSTGTSPGVAVTSPGITISNSAPSVTGVVILVGSNDGRAYKDIKLTANYVFQDPDGDGQGASTYQWLRNGVDISGVIAQAQTYIVVNPADISAKLTVRVTPKDDFVQAALTGTPVVSPLAIIPVNLAPVASNVRIIDAAGSTPAKRILAALYDYADHEGDAAGTPLYVWKRNGVPVASTASYALSLSDTGQVINVEITPVAQNGAQGIATAAVTALNVPAVTVALNVSAGLKQLHFSWAAVPGAASYRLTYSPDVGLGFVPVSTTSSNLTTTTYDWDISVHRINWPNAQFLLEACDASICLPSANISALNVMVGAIGYFKASNTEAGDWFGYTVALSDDGNTLAVGAFLESSAGIGGNPVDDCAAAIPVNCAKVSGAVYVYSRSGITWSQQAYVKASNPSAGDYFSTSIALSADGNTLAVGAQGEASSTTGINSTPNELADYAGAVYVFTRNTTTTTWSQQAYVKALNAGASDFFGTSVALSNDGNTLAVGATREASNTSGINSTPNELAYGAGAVYVFTRSSATATATWTQQAYVKASNTGGDDYFGQSVALSADGNTLAVAASGEDSSTMGINSTPDELSLDSGAVYVFTRSSTTTATWSQQAYVKASNTGASDYFGAVALSADGNTLAVGASGEDSAAAGNPLDDCGATTPANCAKDSGAVYIYTHSTFGWLQEAYVKASNAGAGDYFGQVALSANGNMLAVGAFFESSSSTGINRTPNELAYAAGAVYVLTRSGTAWTQQAYVKASNTNTYDYFGRSIALSADGNTLAVGAHPEGSKATGVNNTVPGQSDNSAPAAGAVYLY